MESRFHGVPPSAAQMAPKAATPPHKGIRAPLTVDESDFEYSASSKSRRNSTISSYYSGSELESESGEDELETVSESPHLVEKDEKIIEETHFVKEFTVSEPSVKSPHENFSLESGNVSKHAVLRLSVRSPDENFGQENGKVSNNAVLRPSVRIPDRIIYKGSSNIDDSDDSGLFSSESDDELGKDERYVVKNEEVSENGLSPLVGSRISPVRKVRIPIAQISADSDDDSQGSWVSDGEGFAGIVRIPSIEVLRRINSAPKVRVSVSDEGEDDESQGELVEDSVISNVVLGPSDEKENLDVDERLDIEKEAMYNLLVVNEEFGSPLESGQNGGSVHLDEEIQEIDVVDEQKKCVELADIEELDFKSELGQNGDAMYLDEEIQEIDVVDEQTKKFVELADNEKLDFKSESGNNGDAMHLDEEIQEIDVVDEHTKKCMELADNVELDSTSESGQHGDAMHFGEEIQEIDVIDEQMKKCVELADNAELDSTSELGQNGDVMHFGAEIQEIDFIDEQTKKCKELGDKEELDSKSESGQNGVPIHLDEEIQEIAIDEQKKCVESVDHREPTDSSEDVIFPENISDRKEKVESDGEREIRSVRQYVDIKEVPAEGCGDFPELPVSQVYMSDSLFEDATLTSVVDAGGESFLECSVLGHEARTEDENCYRLSSEVEESTLHSEISNHADRTSDNIYELEEIQQIRVKYLHLLHGLGRSPEDSVASKVLHQLTLAEKSSSPRAFHLDSTKKGDLDFSLSILVVGKTGVGKSATINSIFRQKKAIVDAFEPSTARMKEIIGTIDGVKIKIYDTPGLRSSFLDQSINRKILSSIKKLMQKSPPDVILYVDRLDTQTGPNDVPLLKLLTSYLGSSIWRKSVIAFTHGSLTLDLPDGPNGCPLSYEAFLSQRSRIIQQLIGPSTVPVCVVENHPFAEENGIGETLLLCYSMKMLSELSFLEPSLSYFPRSDIELCYLSDSVKETAVGSLSETPLPPSSDGDRFRFLIPSSRLLASPIFDSPWDRDDTSETSARLAIAFVGENVATGVKVRNRLAVGKRSTLSGRICIKTRGSDQLQIAAMAFVPIASILFKKIFRQRTQD